MPNPDPTTAPESQGPRPTQALEHLTDAHQHLTTLRDRLGILYRHPELEQALNKVELALSALSVSTGGMW